MNMRISRVDEGEREGERSPSGAEAQNEGRCKDIWELRGKNGLR